MTERLVAVTELVADGILGDLVSAFRPGDESFPSHRNMSMILRH